MKHKYGPWALVTGAAEGLGKEFARQVASEGLNVVLVDIQQQKLETFAAVLEQDFHVETSVVACDLASDDFMKTIIKATEDLSVHLLVNNAGISKVAPFLSMQEGDLLEQLYVNTRAVLLLTRYFAERMASEGRGGIIIVSSASAIMSGGFLSGYQASKAWGLKLAESLWFELQSRGVDVLGFMPVQTDTAGLRNAGYRGGGNLMQPQQAVSEALATLGKKPVYLAGKGNRLMFWLVLALMPVSWRIRLVSENLKKRFTIHW